MSNTVQGQCLAKFAEVKAEFERNFTERDEVGASVSLSVNGESMVDLWGGVADAKTGEAWQEDTMSIVFSCSKAATALCAHILIDRGLLKLHAPVTDYWPEFGQHGKDKTTVQMMLNHQSGVPALREPVKAGGFYDWDYMVDRLAHEKPFWQPGDRNGYHMVTFGWTVGELVRRASGMSLNDFFQQEVAGPTGAEFYIGLPEDVQPHMAPMIAAELVAGEPFTEFTEAIINDQNSIQALSILNVGGWTANDPAAHRAQIGGAGGISNARNQVRMYEPLAMGGSKGKLKLVSADRLAHMSRISVATENDATLLAPTRFASGFMKSMDNRALRLGNQKSMILGEHAFGHAGAGGSVGFADPECGLAFSYTMNKMGPGILLKERGQKLVDAAYKALGYQSDRSGAWRR